MDGKEALGLAVLFKQSNNPSKRRDVANEEVICASTRFKSTYAQNPSVNSEERGRRDTIQPLLQAVHRATTTTSHTATRKYVLHCGHVRIHIEIGTRVALKIKTVARSALRRNEGMSSMRR